jgi:xanthine dehydrogenase accessory factor
MLACVLIVVRGGGDLGTGIAHALAAAGHRVCVVDLPKPTALRLTVSFAAAALRGSIVVDEMTAVHCQSAAEIDATWIAGQVPVWSRPEAELDLSPDAVVDSRMKGLSGAQPPTTLRDAPRVIGVGPGFVAGEDCHLVVESNRGPTLGQTIRSGSAATHTGEPGLVEGHAGQRLLRAPQGGAFVRRLSIGDPVEVGDVVGEVDGAPVMAGLSGMIRGLKLSGIHVGSGHKVGDVDPRRDPALLEQMTDKARAVGQGVLRALNTDLGGD